MLKKVGQFILQNRNQGALVALVFTFIPLFGWVSSVVLALVTLRKGGYEGWWVLLWISLPDVVYTFVAGSPEQLFFSVLGINVCTWVIALVLRQFNSWGNVLEITGLISILGVLTVHFYSPQINTWWANQYHQMLDNALADPAFAASTQGSRQPDWPQFIAMMQQMVEPLSRVSTGIAATFTMMCNLINLGLARWWQASIFNPGGLQKELHQICLSYRSVVTLGVCLILVAMGLAVPQDFLPVVLGVFLVAGISLLHCSANKIRNSVVWLVVFYLCMIILPAYFLGLLIVAAIADSLLNVRHRFKLS
jgi:hypothetical protein